MEWKEFDGEWRAEAECGYYRVYINHRGNVTASCVHEDGEVEMYENEDGTVQDAMSFVDKARRQYDHDD